MEAEEREALAAVEEARARARAAAPRREAVPDPLALPPLPEAAIEFPARDEPLGDHVPDAFVDAPPLSLALWREILERDLRLRFTSHRGLLGRLIVAAKRLLAPLVRAPLSVDFQRERLFHLAVLRHLEEIRAYLRAIRDPYSFVRDRAVPDLVARSDALFGILDRRLDALEGELRHHDAGHSPAAAAPAAPREREAPPPSAALFADRTYFRFEELHRGSEEEIRRRQTRYVPLFAGAALPVLDLGCGRGEMLALLREAGVRAYGVDANPAMIAACRAQGLEVVQADAIEHLRALEAGSLGGAFSAQTFEHWEREPVVEAVKLLHRALAAGAPLVVETQNPTSLVVGASSFWRDLTHVRPLHPEALEFLVSAVGFRSIEVRPVSPFPPEERLPRVRELAGMSEAVRALVEDVNRALDAVDERLHGHRDYAIIARK